MNGKRVLLAIIIAGITMFLGLAVARQSAPPEGNKLRVTTSFYPLYFFAKEIGADRATVINITPAGAEPHDYEPTTQDIGAIEKSSILIINGNKFEPWAEKIKNDLKNKNITIVEGMEALADQQDPHVWLDPTGAKQEVQIIAQAFEKKDPANARYYASNAIRLMEKLDALHLEFQKGLSSCQQKNIVTSHAAFGLLASRYNMKQIPIAGISPDSEPSPKKLAEIADLAKANSINYIFFEELISPRLAETLAREIGAQTLVLHPIEGLTPEELSLGYDYFFLQRENLANLKVALACQ